MSLSFTLVVGMAADRAIGKDGTMPWHLPEDLKLFRRLTTGHPILMGRKTYESIGRPLPGRQNIVLSRQSNLQIEGVTCISSLDELEGLALQDEEVMVIGGAEIYALALPRVATMWVSEVEGDFDADTYFPPFENLFTKRMVMEQFEGFKLVRYCR